MSILKPIRAIQLNKSHPLARGLVACWLFNEGAGGKVFDLSGNGNTGNLQGDTSWRPGRFGLALEFDGTGDEVNCGNNATLEMKTSDWTIGAWVKFNDAGNQTMVYKGAGSPTMEGYLFWYYSTNGDLRFYISDGVSRINAHSDDNLNLYDGAWHFVAVSVDRSSNAVFYLDGQNVGSYNISSFDGTDITNSSLSLKIGRAYSGLEMNGIIDNTIIFKRALSAKEVAWLYREPFCVFAVTIQPEFLFPTGQIVLLAAASTATSSAHGLLTKHSKLAGIIDTVATLSATLTWHYCGPVERQWLVEALFDGMTANAFKLGTVLTGGWFWMRRSGCSALYRGPSMEQIDFANILTVDEQDAGSISPPDYIPHDSNSTYFYVVRRFNNCGYQERTLAAAVKVAIDADGNLIEPKPNNIFAWRLDQVYSNRIQLIWFYCPLEQDSRPESFKIYYDGGTGHIDYENPIATVNYQGRKFYTYQSDTLAADRYLFAVRAEDAAGIENNSLAQLGIQLSTKSPDAIDILSVTPQ